MPSDKINLSNDKWYPAAAQKPSSANNKTTLTGKGQVDAGNSTKIAIEPPSGNTSTKQKIVVPENAYAADWEEVTALMDEVLFSKCNNLWFLF